MFLRLVEKKTMQPVHQQLLERSRILTYGANPVSDYAIGLLELQAASTSPESVQLLKEAAGRWTDSGGGDEIFRTIGEGDRSFDDVIGLEKEKKVIRESVIAPFLLPNFFGEAPKGILFYGPPGGGKTLLAEATITELRKTVAVSIPDADVALIAPTAADLKGKYVGESEKKISELFRVAKNRPCQPGKTMKISIIFIDEIEGLVQSRSLQTDQIGNSVATFLQELDDLKTLSTVILMGATNFPEKIDEAVMRRLPAKIFVPLPIQEDIALWLKKKVSKFPWISKEIYQETYKVSDIEDVVPMPKDKVFAAKKLRKIFKTERELRDISYLMWGKSYSLSDAENAWDIARTLAAWREVGLNYTHNPGGTVRFVQPKGTRGESFSILYDGKQYFREDWGENWLSDEGKLIRVWINNKTNRRQIKTPDKWIWENGQVTNPGGYFSSLIFTYRKPPAPEIRRPDSQKVSLAPWGGVPTMDELKIAIQQLNVVMTRESKEYKALEDFIPSS
ncbi:MAG TPA: ATP-binding protein [Patescibacteria group bacterium]|nr:ATP-binding protein [Patescibacteria group bacterium]